MTTIEDRLRAAATAAAGTVAPGSAPPLRLPREPGRRSGPGRRGSREKWTRRMAPLAAAAAVIAVVAASLAVAGGAPGHRSRPQPHAARASALAALPPYYVMLTGRNPDPTVLQPQHAVIRATATGALLSAIGPPSPYSTFISVAGAGNGHTFVLAAEKLVVDHVDGGVSQQGAPVKFFLLRLAADGAPKLTALPIPPEPASAGLAGIALSPDGSKLAVAIDSGQGPRIQVFSTATGSEHDWTWPGGGGITNNAGGRGQVLSWAADDRTVAFQLWRGSNISIGLADTAASGPGSGRLVFTFAGAATDSAHGDITFNGTTALITPDGAAIVCAVLLAGPRGQVGYGHGFMEISTRAGQLLRMVGPRQYSGYKLLQDEDVLWANASGSRLIVIADVPAAKPRTYRLQIGTLGGRSFTPLPGAQLASELFSYPAW
jgi:hypothetical protein